ncbi:bestrophin family protein [Adhaeribacter aquaticus]|uniref:bestrophin family protein n=1 Tax=Adhaeribacter aquaticus TaxID=299567 RepID=UPI00047E23A9|nr:bestrophin family ion channel [Adhaeribacter aquaticus]
MLLKKNIPISYVFGKVKYEVSFVLIYATLIGTWDKYFHVINISIPLSVPMILGTVLSLLLAFKSNQAYDRWWEARIIWGAIVNDSRTLTRQLLNFIADPYVSVNVKDFQDRFTYRQIAWCYSLGQSLRNESPIEGLPKYLTPGELEFVSKHDNVPNALLQLHARDLKRLLEDGQINKYQQVEIDGTLTRLCDAMGKCERIKNTVFPVTYGLYIHFSLFIFILLLPFALLETFGILQIPMVAIIAASFFLIEKMAIHLQDPFENRATDTPVTAISRTIERNLMQMINDYQIPDKINSTDFYVL